MNYALNLVDGHRTLPALLEDLRAARRSIHLSTFLFFNDPVGQLIANVLCEKAMAGVRVRVIINLAKTKLGDPFSTGEQEMMEEDDTFDEDAMDAAKLAERMRGCGVHVLDSNLDFDRTVLTDDVRLLEQRSLICHTSRMDTLHVDHRKVIVIDGAVGYCGSANIGAQYLFFEPFDPQREAHDEADERRAAGLPEPWWKWHDGLVRFEGPAAFELDRYFRERWVLDGGEDYGEVEVFRRRSAPLGVQVERVDLFANQPDSTPNACRRVFLDCIASAERSIFIENPYLYHPEIIHALCAAKRARPELSVTLVVPGMKWNDNEYAQDAMEHHYARLIGCGIRVFEYQHHFTHLKLATFDERVSIVGSANLNFRSLENDTDFELIARVESGPFTRAINAEVRDEDLRAAVEITRARLNFSKRHRDPRTLFLVSRRVL